MWLSSFRRNLARRKALQAIARLRTRTVSDVLTRYIVTIRPGETTIQAATKMVAEDVSCLIVKDGDRLCGIISERDFLTKVPLTKRVFSMQVKDIMTPAVVTVPPDMLLPDAVELMRTRKFRRLVVAEGERLLGVVTQTDLSREIREAFSHYPSSVSLQVRGIMRKPVLITPKENFKVAREKMKKASIGGAIIVNKASRPHEVLGFFSEYDVVMQFYDRHGKLDVHEVSSFTRKYVRAIPVGTNVFEANQLLLEKKIHRLPVVDDKGVVGILTQTEMVRFVYCNLDMIESQINQDGTSILKPDRKDFKGEFKHEHLKVYTMQSLRLEKG